MAVSLTPTRLAFLMHAAAIGTIGSTAVLVIGLVWLSMPTEPAQLVAGEPASIALLVGVGSMTLVAATLAALVPSMGLLRGVSR